MIGRATNRRGVLTVLENPENAAFLQIDQDCQSPIDFLGSATSRCIALTVQFRTELSNNSSYPSENDLNHPDQSEFDIGKRLQKPVLRLAFFSMFQLLSQYLEFRSKRIGKVCRSGKISRDSGRIRCHHSLPVDKIIRSGEPGLVNHKVIGSNRKSPGASHRYPGGCPDDKKPIP
jgi:hypothetical protein